MELEDVNNGGKGAMEDLGKKTQQVCPKLVMVEPDSMVKPPKFAKPDELEKGRNASGELEEECALWRLRSTRNVEKGGDAPAGRVRSLHGS